MLGLKWKPSKFLINTWTHSSINTYLTPRPISSAVYTIEHIQVYSVHIDTQLGCQWSLLFVVLWPAFFLLGMSVVGLLEKNNNKKVPQPPSPSKPLGLECWWWYPETYAGIFAYQPGDISLCRVRVRGLSGKFEWQVFTGRNWTHPRVYRPEPWQRFFYFHLPGWEPVA